MMGRQIVFNNWMAPEELCFFLFSLYSSDGSTEVREVATSANRGAILWLCGVYKVGKHKFTNLYA